MCPCVRPRVQSKVCLSVCVCVRARAYAHTQDQRYYVRITNGIMCMCMWDTRLGQKSGWLAASTATSGVYLCILYACVSMRVYLWVFYRLLHVLTFLDVPIRAARAWTSLDLQYTCCCAAIHLLRAVLQYTCCGPCCAACARGMARVEATTSGDNMLQSVWVEAMTSGGNMSTSTSLSPKT